MKVRGIMTKGVRTCRPETNLATVAGRMWEADCGALPVVDARGHLVGIVTDRDVAIAVGTRHRLASHISVSDIMTVHVYTCEANDDLETALSTMATKRVRRLPVLEGGALVGLLSLSDVARHASDAPGSAIGYADSGRVLREVCGQRAHAAAL
jgi:CBS domain-containing protein